MRLPRSTRSKRPGFFDKSSPLFENIDSLISPRMDEFIHPFKNFYVAFRPFPIGETFGRFMHRTPNSSLRLTLPANLKVPTSLPSTKSNGWRLPLATQVPAKAPACSADASPTGPVASVKAVKITVKSSKTFLHLLISYLL